MTSTDTQNNRQYYLDWIRVITILLVFLFHGGRFFDTDDWHVKNATSYPAADLLLFLLKEWMMPIFFFISGASTWFAMSHKSTGKFMLDRVYRILVPLLFGIFLLSPPQVYLERFSHHQFSGSFWQFIPAYFNGWYGFGGNFAWMGLHLWYLLLLFIFSFFALPLFIYWNRKPVNTGRFPFIIFLVFIILLAAPDTLLPLDNILVNRSFGGWGLAEHLVVFIAGFYAFSRVDMFMVTIKYRYLFLIVMVVTTSINAFLYLNHMLYVFGTIGYCLKIGLRSLVCFAWILTIIGFSANSLNRTNRFLKYSNTAVLPFYIAHQPILLLVGYFIIQFDINPVAKYLVIIFTSFVIVLLCYEYVIKRINIFRRLFGMGTYQKS